MSSFTVTLDLPHPPPDLFRFLADPYNRPLWQGSLKTVTDVDPGEPHRGQQWRDVTKVGLKPWMELTDLTPFRHIGEAGNWHGVDGILHLRFLKIQQGTRITAEGRVIGRGPFAVAAAVSGRWAPETIRKDLLRASDVIAEQKAQGGRA